MKAECTSLFEKDEEIYSKDLKTIYNCNDGKLTYDDLAKSILSNKAIIARILHELTDEFRNLEVREIINQLKSGITEAKIACNKEEDAHSDMVKIAFDVDANLVDADSNINIEIDIEPQNVLHPSYNLYKRGVYYCCRMIDRQLGPHDKAGYNKLHKCYSIWLCFQSDASAGGDMLRFNLLRDEEDVRALSFKEAEASEIAADLVKLIYIYVPKTYNKANTDIQRILYGVFHRDMPSIEEYFTSTEYDTIYEEVTEMGRLEQAIRDSSKAEGIIKGKVESVQKLLSVGWKLDDALHLLELDKAAYDSVLAEQQRSGHL